MDDGQLIFAIVAIFAFIGIYIVALLNAPVFTILATFAVVILGGIFTTSGRGDGRQF